MKCFGEWFCGLFVNVLWTLEIIHSGLQGIKVGLRSSS